MSYVRSRLAAAALLVAVLIGGAAQPARAQLSELKDDRCTAESAEGESGLGGGGVVGGGAGGGGGGSWGGQPAPSTTTTTSKVDDKEAEAGVCGNLLSQMIPGPDPGTYPTNHYDIGYDSGGNCVCYDRRAIGLVTQFFFWLNGWVVRIGIGLITWVLEFAIARLLMPSAQRVSDAFQYQIVGPVGLSEFFLFLCACWAFFLAATGRLGRGAGELGTSLVLIGLAAAIWTNPGASLQRGLEFTAGVGSEIAAVGTGASSSGGQVVGAPMALAIHEAFVERPHELINWGRRIPPGDQCRAVYDRAVATGPWGTSSKPRIAMKEAGCKAEDRANRNPSLDRLGVALLTLVSSVLLIGLLLRVTWELIKAQLEVLLSVVLWPFAQMFAALPGRGRTGFWHWIAATAMALGRVLAVMLALALTLTAVAAILEATSSEAMGAQMLVVIAAILVGFWKMKGLTEGSKRMVTQFTQSMSGRVPVRSASWLTPVTAGFTGGAMANRAAHALQTHKVNARGKENLELSRGILDAERGGGGSTFTNFGGDNVQNVLVLLNGAGQRTRARPQGGSEPAGLPAGTVIPLADDAVREPAMASSD